MSLAYKQFTSYDYIMTPYELSKGLFFRSGSEIGNAGIKLYSGSYDSSSGDLYLYYKSILHLYYNNYISQSYYSSSYESGSNISYNQSTLNYGKKYTPVNLDKVNIKFLPYDSGSHGNLDNLYSTYIISIPKVLYGDSIKPGSFYAENVQGLGESVISSFKDDGEGNIIHNQSYYVGNIFYSHGIILINNNPIEKDTGYISKFIEGGLDKLDIYFSSSYEMHEIQYRCLIRENEFNFSLNPTLLSGSSNFIKSEYTSSNFNPYISCVGLYNNNKDLVAVAKLAQPIKLSQINDTNIIINYDTI